MALLILGGSLQGLAQEIRPGVWAGSGPAALPLPTGGYQAYLVGEWHGIEQNHEFQLQYLALLVRESHLRNVALEEKAVYQNAAQAYVAGRSANLPTELCLRASLLLGIRQLNLSLSKTQRIRVHLVDIDSPAAAIRQHLLEIRNRVPAAATVAIPNAEEIKDRGLAAVEQLRRFDVDSKSRGDLRTVEYSIRALQEGFEVGIGPGKGSPYLEDREQAIASNIGDLLRESVPSLLVIYGSDHVSRSMRKDGGPNRDQPFAPMALRLERSGIKAFSVVTFPLADRYFWRGRAGDLPYTAKDGHLDSGETLDRVLASAPAARYVYVDPRRQKVVLPSTDVSRFAVDAFVLFPSGTPMTNHCPSSHRSK
jgi:hypothetical protein